MPQPVMSWASALGEGFSQAILADPGRFAGTLSWCSGLVVGARGWLYPRAPAKVRPAKFRVLIDGRGRGLDRNWHTLLYNGRRLCVFAPVYLLMCTLVRPCEISATLNQPLELLELQRSIVWKSSPVSPKSARHSLAPDSRRYDRRPDSKHSTSMLIIWMSWSPTSRGWSEARHLMSAKAASCAGWIYRWHSGSQSSEMRPCSNLQKKVIPRGPG